MTRRYRRAAEVRRVLAVLAWSALVLACSTGVWAVIRTAGEDVTTTGAVPSSTTGVEAPTASASPSPHPHRARRSPAATAPTTPASTRPPASTGPTATPQGQTATPRPSQRPAPQPRPSRTTAPEPATTTRTWQGSAGSVTASCRGGTITFRGAQPNSGWRVEVGNRGPEGVEVTFQKGEDSGEVEVHARCSGGEPSFSVHGD